MTGSFIHSFLRVGEWVRLFDSLPCFVAAPPEVLDASLQCRDLTEPALLVSLGETVLGVGGHLLDAAKLGRIDAKETATPAAMFMHARGPVGSVALAERYSAEQEVLLELSPFNVVGDLSLGLWPQQSSSLDEGLVRGDEVLCRRSDRRSSQEILDELADVQPLGAIPRD